MLALEGNDEHPVCHRTTEISSSRTAFPPTDGWRGGRRAERIRIAERTRGVRRTVVFGISARGCPARRHQPERPDDPIAIAYRRVGDLTRRSQHRGYATATYFYAYAYGCPKKDIEPGAGFRDQQVIGTMTGVA